MLLRAILLGFAAVVGCVGFSVSTPTIHYKIQAHFDAIDHSNIRFSHQRLRNVTKHESAVESVLRTRLADPRLSVRIVDERIHGEEANLPTSWIEAFVSLSKEISRDEMIELLHDESTAVILYHLERVGYVPTVGSTQKSDFAAILGSYRCFNGGVLLPNQTCVCKQYFGGADCSSNVCNHNGIVTDKNRCSCPPGFIGRHCEIMPCLPPVQDTFDFSTRSLIYVISLRDSMGRDIQQIYESTAHLLQKYPAETFSSFVLTTFLAKGTTYSIHTNAYRTLSDFQQAIANTVISSGSTLQPSVAAIRGAISTNALLRPKSSIFVFTDSASLNATDADFSEMSSTDESYVTKGGVHWGLKVFFFVTDSPDYPITSTTDNSYNVYYRIAQNSLGEVVQVGAKKTLGHAFLTFAGYQYDTEAIAISSNYNCSIPRSENLVIDSELKNKEYFVYTTGHLTLSYNSQTATPLQTVANVNIYTLNASVTTLTFAGNAAGLCSYKVFVQSLQSVVFGWTVTNTSIDYADGLSVAQIPHNGIARPINVNGEVVGLSFAALNVNDNSVIANSSSKAKDRSAASGTLCSMPWIFGKWENCTPGPFYSQVDVRYMGGKKFRRIVPGFCQIPNEPPINSSPTKCENGGHLNASESCICKSFFTGKHCENLECVNGGSPNPYPGGPNNLPLCSCPQGYQGEHCETLSCSTTASESFNTDKRTLGLAFQTTQSTALVGSHIAAALQSLTAFYASTFNDVYFDSFVFTSFVDSEISSTSFNASAAFISAVQSAQFKLSNAKRQNVFSALEQLIQTNVSSTSEGVRFRSPVFIVVDSPVGDSLRQIDQTKAVLVEKMIFLNIIVIPQYFDTCAVSSVDMAIYNVLAQSTGGVVLDLCDPSKTNRSNIDTFINNYGQTFYRREVVAETKAQSSTLIEKIYVNNAKETFYITGWSDQITDFTALFSKGAIPLTLETFVHLPQMTIFKITGLQSGIYNLKFSANSNVTYALNVAQPSLFNTWLGFSTDPSEDYFTSSAYYGQTVHPVVHLSSALQGDVIVNVTATAIGHDYSYVSTGALRSSSCAFEYFFEKNFACPVNNGYFYFLVEVHSSDNVVIQRSIPGFCYGVGKQECINGGTWNGFKCSCAQPEGQPPRYTGDHCEFPICQNGGILENMACTCPTLTSGTFCEFIQCNQWDYFTQLDKSSSTFSTITFIVQNQVESVLVNTYLKHTISGFIDSFDGAGIERQLSLVTFDDVSVTNVVSTPVVEKFLREFNASVGQVAANSQVNRKGKMIEAVRSAYDITMYKPAVFYVFTSTDTVYFSGFTKVLQNLAKGGVEVNIIFSPNGGPDPKEKYDFLNLFPSATNGRFIISDNTNINEFVSKPMKSMVFENGIVYDTVLEDCSSQSVSANFPIESRSSWVTILIRGPNNAQNLTVFDGKNNQITLHKSNVVFNDSNTLILQFYRSKMAESYVGLWTIQTLSTCNGGQPRCGCSIQARVASTLEARVGFAVNQHDDFVERAPFSVSAKNRSVFITAQITNTLYAKEEATMDELRVYSRAVDLTKPQLLLDTHFITRDANTCSNQFVTPSITFPEVPTSMSLTVIAMYGVDENAQNFQRVQSFYNHKQDCGQFGSWNEFGQCECDLNHRGFFCQAPICVNGGTTDLSVCNCNSGYYGDFCHNRVAGSSATNTTFPPLSTTSTSAVTTSATSTYASTTTVAVTTSTSKSTITPLHTSSSTQSSAASSSSVAASSSTQTTQTPETAKPTTTPIAFSSTASTSAVSPTTLQGTTSTQTISTSQPPVRSTLPPSTSALQSSTLDSTATPATTSTPSVSTTQEGSTTVSSTVTPSSSPASPSVSTTTVDASTSSQTTQTPVTTESLSTVSKTPASPTTPATTAIPATTSGPSTPKPTTIVVPSTVSTSASPTTQQATTSPQTISTTQPPATPSLAPPTSTLQLSTKLPSTLPSDCSPYFYSFYITFFFDTGMYGQSYMMQLDIPEQIDNSTVPEETVFNYYGISTNQSTYYGTPFNRWNEAEMSAQLAGVKKSSEATKNITLSDALKHFTASGDATHKTPAVGRTLVIFAADTVTDTSEAEEVVSGWNLLNPPVLILVVGRTKDAASSLKNVATYTYVGNNLSDTTDWILEKACPFNMSN